VSSSTGLPTAFGATLAYAGWWLTGLIFWFVERRDPVVRFHAAQAVAAFGALALLIGGLAALALVSLSFFPSLFEGLLLAAQAAAALSVVLWTVTVWQVASGRDWRIPIAARWADRLAATASERAAS
jgi:uncharacterized membrane protein